jgi:hypothetical protein
VALAFVRVKLQLVLEKQQQSVTAKVAIHGVITG